MTVKVAAMSMFVAAGGVVLLSPQAGAACDASANKPTYNSDTKVLKGSGGQSGCTAGSSATVLLRHQHWASPDTTVAQSDGVGNFTLTVSKANPENGTYYTETRSSNGSKDRSSDYDLG